MKQEQLICTCCGETFSKPSKEVARQRARNPQRAFYCSRSCYARHVGQHNLGHHLGRGNPAVLDPGNRQDEFSPFRYFMRKARNRPQHTDLDLCYLRDLWASQRGRCALSGIPLELPRNTLEWERRVRDPWKPSLDRIDSSRGYIRGNVRYVAMIGNLAKQRFTDDELFEFCGAVAEFQGLVVSDSAGWAFYSSRTCRSPSTGSKRESAISTAA